GRVDGAAGVVNAAAHARLPCARSTVTAGRCPRAAQAAGAAVARQGVVASDRDLCQITGTRINEETAACPRAAVAARCARATVAAGARVAAAEGIGGARRVGEGDEAPRSVKATSLACASRAARASRAADREGASSRHGEYALTAGAAGAAKALVAGERAAGEV